MSLRWYDRDPALSRALEQLRNAGDKYQAQIALNIINIIVEHLIENQTDSQINANGHENQHIVTETGSPQENTQRRRWYDVNETLRSAMQLLHDCPDELQQSVIPSIARMIEKTLEESLAPLSDCG